MENNDDEIPISEEKKIPLFLIITYILVLIIGFYGFYAYWNGSKSFSDRGHWQKLQNAAETTYPFKK